MAADIPIYIGLGGLAYGIYYLAKQAKNNSNSNSDPDEGSRLNQQESEFKGAKMKEDKMTRDKMARRELADKARTQYIDSPYTSNIVQARAMSDGTEVDFQAKLRAIVAKQSRMLIDIARARSIPHDDQDYDTNLKAVYSEFYDLHTLKLTVVL
jgi:hypothetical protein